MTNQYPVEIDGVTGEVEPIPHQKGQRYRCKLGDIDRGIVNAGTQYRQGLKAHREQSAHIVNAIETAVDERTKHIRFFTNFY